MISSRRIIVAGLLALGLGAPLVGCAYSDMKSFNGKLYVTRDGLFFGAGRQIYECTPDGAGNMTCVALEGRP